VFTETVKQESLKEEVSNKDDADDLPGLDELLSEFVFDHNILSEKTVGLKSKVTAVIDFYKKSCLLLINFSIVDLHFIDT
jgi:hypothetical protein